MEDEMVFDLLQEVHDLVVDLLDEVLQDFNLTFKLI
jgi:hypothetical protein